MPEKNQESEETVSEKPFVKPPIYARAIGTAIGLKNALTHKTILYVIDNDNGIEAYKCTETIHDLITKDLVVVKETSCLRNKRGNKIYFANYGESFTTDRIDLRRKIWDYDERSQAIESDKLRKSYEFNHIRNIVDSLKYGSMPLMLTLVILLAGIGLGYIIADSFGSEDTEITVNGDYNEEKTENNNPSDGTNNNPGGGTVIVP